MRAGDPFKFMITLKNSKTNSSKSKKKICSELSKSATNNVNQSTNSKQKKEIDDRNSKKKEVSSMLPKPATDATKNATITLRSHKNLTQLDIKILLLHMDNEKDFTQKNVTFYCKSNKSIISRHIRKLQKNGYLKVVQKGKPTICKLTKMGYNVSCSFLRGYERGLIDRLHNIKARCEFKIKRKGKPVVKWKSYPMMNWNKYFKWIEYVYIWYNEKGNTMHYQLPHIFANTPQKAMEKAFELIQRVNEQLRKEGFVFTSRPEIDKEDITITDSHHAHFLDPIAVWLKNLDPSVSIRYKNTIEYDSSFKKYPEMDVVNFPYNQEGMERYLQVAMKIMKGELKLEELPEQLRVNMSVALRNYNVLQEMNKNIEVMYDQFGRSITGTTTFVNLVPRILEGLNNVTQAVIDRDKDGERIRELEKKFDVQEIGKDDKIFLLIKNTIKNLLLKIFFFFKKLV